MGVTMLIAGSAVAPSAAAAAGPCSLTLTGDTVVTDLKDAEQRANAATIAETGGELNIPARGLIVAIATAMQESGLRNLDGGDRDSVGLFQQRNGWGSFAERTDPKTSATLFFTGGHAGQPGLVDINDWESMAVTEAAQAVQRSAFPNAYAKWEPLAARVVAELVGSTDTVSDCTNEPGDAETDCAKVTTVQPITATVMVGGIRVHSCVQAAVAAMLEAANADGRNLTGSGWRDTKRQEELRVINGCPDVYRSPASSCRVPTAIPGSSQHERGLAVDFNLGPGDHAWLAANAGRFGFKQLPAEAWHWSTTGR